MSTKAKKKAVKAAKKSTPAKKQNASKKAAPKPVAKKAPSKPLEKPAPVAAKKTPKNNPKPATPAEDVPVYISHIKTARSITITYKEGKGTKSATFSSGQDAFTNAMQVLQDNPKAEWPTLLIDLLPRQKVRAASGGRIQLVDGCYQIEGAPIPHELSDTLKMRIGAGLSTRPFELFWEKLRSNPSDRSRNQFFRFIQKNGVTILEDGRLVLYKGVRSDLKSLHDGKTQHKVGEYTSVPRQKVVDDHSACAAYGLHIAPWSHVKNYYGKHNTFLELYVDPADIVSVPSDSDSQKIRCWRYYVNGVVNSEGEGVRTGLFAKIGEKPVAQYDESQPDKLHEESPKPAAKNKDEVKRRARAEMDAKEHAHTTKPAAAKVITVEVVADKLTLPGNFLAHAGFLPKGEVELYVLPRKLVILSPGAGVVNRRKMYAVEKADMHDLKTTVNSSLTLRRSLLLDGAMKGSKFRVECKSQGIVEIEPAK